MKRPIASGITVAAEPARVGVDALADALARWIICSYSPCIVSVPNPFARSTDGTVDMWLWQAGGQANPGVRADVDTAYQGFSSDNVSTARSLAAESSRHIPLTDKPTVLDGTLLILR